MIPAVPAGQNNNLEPAGDNTYRLRSPDALVSTLKLVDQGQTTEAIIINGNVAAGFGPSDPVRKLAKSFANTLYSKALVPASDLSRLLVNLTG